MYRLQPPAGSLSGRLKQHAQDEFEAQTLGLVKSLQASPDERQQIRSDPLTTQLMDDSRTMGGIGIFATLSSDQQLSILRGTNQLSMNVQDLSDAGRDYVNSEIDTYQPKKPASGDKIYFSANRMDPFLTPTLFMQIAGYGGGGYAGGVPLNTRLYSEALADWMHEGDTRTDPAAHKTVDAPTKPNEAIPDPNTDYQNIPPGERQRANKLVERVAEERMKQVAELGHIPVVALLPVRQADPGDPCGKAT